MSAPFPDKPAESPEAREDRDRLWFAFVLSASFVAVLWLVKIFEFITGFSAVEYGVYPRKLSGLVGILTYSFIHGSPTHLISNTPPVIILGTTLLYGYPKSARIVIPALILVTGLCVWLFGRESYHVGASGLTFGAMFFVFTVGALRWDRRAIGLSLVVFFLYGGMVWGLIPDDPQISYESHLSGAITGITLAFLLRKLDPLPRRKRYSWEDEPDATTAKDGDLPPDDYSRD